MKILNFHKVKKMTNLHSAETTYPVSGQIRFEYIVLFLASLTLSAVPRSHRVLPKKQRVWWRSEWPSGSELYRLLSLGCCSSNISGEILNIKEELYFFKSIF